MNLDESRDEILRKVRNLPSNWWQSANAADALIRWFERNIIGLLLAGMVEGTFQCSVYTGFLLRHGKYLLWLTAGHIVDELDQILSSEKFEITKFCWLDNYDSPAANAVLVHRKDMPKRSWKDASSDFGVVLPSVLDAGNLLNNPSVEIIEESIWKNLSQADPEGYYAIGYPKSWTSHSSKKVSTSKILHSVEARLAILPLAEISPPSSLSHIPEWTDKQAFYGKILPFTDLPEFEVDDAKGMSGGPILSVERDPSGRIRYRLVGIIQAWYRSESVIRAEPISRIASAISTWLDEG